VIARAVYDLFQTKENSVPNGSERVKVTMSYLEIYNEQAIDLLNDDPASANATLQVRDSKTEGVVIPNLKHFPVSSPEEVRVLMEKASMKRATASTHMNSVSSRSHAICTLNVTIAPNDDENEADEEDQDEDLISPRSLASTSSSSSNHQGMRAKLTLVDLAGSERIKRTGAEGARMKEGININKGLFVLGQVVSALSELGQRNHGGGGHHSHIPYRDSKLTRLLQDSLGGNSRTVMIACISPAESNIEESVNTLRYAERTRNIKNSAVRNVVSSGGLSASEAAALRRENQQLKLELARMESKMIVSSNNGAIVGGNSRGDAGFSFGGLVVSTDNHNMELQAQCSSLLAEIDLLKSRAQGQAKEVLEASLRADKWQAKSEAIVQLAQSQGVDVSEAFEDVSSPNDDIVSQLRSQLTECKAELMEARTEAVVARATAGAIIASKDLSNIEDIIISEDNLNMPASLEDDDDNAQNEQLTTELSTVSATIEQKEAMVLQMNKERACMDNLQLHFENSLRLLQTEIDAVTSERDELTVKMSSNGEKENNTNKSSRNKSKANDPITKKLRGQISKLEDKIDGLKLKTNEHKKSMKMKEDAEKKCARLMAEIAEDKRRRADLQRKLKETSVEMRAEKKAAQKKAAKMMKDGHKLKIELTKMKNAAQKQAAVLKRKIGQASAKEKARAELERKRRSAEKMRLASSSSVDNSDIKESRKIELSSWVDRELEYSLIRFQIDEQRRQLDDAVSKRRKLMKNSGDTVDADELGQMDSTVRSLRKTVQDLEVTVKKAFPTTATDMTSTFRFLETDTFKALSKPDAKYVLSYIFDTCSLAKQEMATIISNQDARAKSSIDSALAKEYQLHEKEITKIKMEHAETTVNLLESTQDIVNSNIKLKMDNDDVAEEELKAQVDGILGTYNESWSSATEDLKFDLDEIKDTQEDLQQMMDNIAKGMSIAAPKKSKTKKKAPRNSYDSEAFESEESFMEDDGGEDSEYEPTPKKSKGKRRSPRLAKKTVAVPSSPASPIGENFINDIDNKRVGSLKKACKKLGMPMTGKKADLKERVREHILNCSVALHNPIDEEKDESFTFGSTMKKVNFAGDVAVDPEFQPVDKNESIKKKLWQETDDDDVVPKEAKKPKAFSSALPPTKPPSKTPSKRTPGKRRRSLSSDTMVGAEKENNNSQTPKKRARPLLGFGSSSPRPLTSHNVKTSRTPVHLKQTIATSKKRLVPDVKQSAAVTKRNITASTKKRTKRGMNDAVARALQQRL